MDLLKIKKAAWQVSSSSVGSHLRPRSFNDQSERFDTFCPASEEVLRSDANLSRLVRRSPLPTLPVGLLSRRGDCGGMARCGFNRSLTSCYKTFVMPAGRYAEVQALPPQRSRHWRWGSARTLRFLR